MSRLLLKLLGGFEAKLEGDPVIGFTTNKVRLLLAYLVMEAKHPHRREALAGLLWPGYPERSARASLIHALSNLRKTLKDSESEVPILVVEGETIQLNAESDVWLDVSAFKSRVVGEKGGASGQGRIAELVEAVALYRGSFLEGSRWWKAQISKTGPGWCAKRFRASDKCPGGVGESLRD